MQEILEGRRDAVGVGELFGRGPDEWGALLGDPAAAGRELNLPALHPPLDMGEDVAGVGQARDRAGA